MKKLSARRLPTHYQTRRWRALLMMLALHRGLMSVYFIIVPFVLVMNRSFPFLGIQHGAWLMQQHIINAQWSIAIFIGFIGADALAWFFFNQLSKTLSQCWAMIITSALILLIISIPVSLFMTMYSFPAIVPSR